MTTETRSLLSPSNLNAVLAPTLAGAALRALTAYEALEDAAEYGGDMSEEDSAEMARLLAALETVAATVKALSALRLS